MLIFYCHISSFFAQIAVLCSLKNRKSDTKICSLNLILYSSTVPKMMSSLLKIKHLAFGHFQIAQWIKKQARYRRGTAGVGCLNIGRVCLPK